MRIIAYDRFRPGVTMETNYARADEPGVVIVFELDTVAEAQRYVDDFPLSKAGLLDWSFIPLTAPLPVESLFAAGVDVGEPLDRTRSTRG